MSTITMEERKARAEAKRQAIRKRAAAEQRERLPATIHCEAEVSGRPRRAVRVLREVARSSTNDGYRLRAATEVLKYSRYMIAKGHPLSKARAMELPDEPELPAIEPRIRTTLDANQTISFTPMDSDAWSVPPPPDSAQEQRTMPAGEPKMNTPSPPTTTRPTGTHRMRSLMPVSLFLGCALLLGGSSPLHADGKNPTFDDDILPVLKQHCVNCHGTEKQKGGLNLATYAAMNAGGSSGVVVAAGDPDKSRLLSLSTHKEEPKMPPSGAKMPDAQLALLKLWIEQGAREKSGSPASVAVKPKTEIGLKSVVKGRPEGPPPMPAAGKLKLDPIVQARRPGAVIALAASPWAPLAAVGGQKQVLLYNTDNNVLVGVLPFEHGQVNSLHFSRNGRFLLAAGGRGGQAGKAVLFNIETGEKVTEVGNESDAILAADISADQTQIAVGGPGKVVRVYATSDGSLIREIKKHTDWVTAIEYSPDGVLLATGDRSGGLLAWEAFTGREFFTLRGHTGAITDLSWRDDSNLLASCSEDGTVRLWEMENGNTVKSWGAHGGGAASVRFSHDGKLATTGRDKLTKVWDQNGAQQKQFDALPDLGLRVAITHENAKAIAGDMSGVVKSWSIADGRALAMLDANPPPLADRIKLAEAALQAAEAKVKATADALAAAQTQAKSTSDAFAAIQSQATKAAADLAAAQKAVTDTAAAMAAAKTVADQAKAESDKANAALDAAASTSIGKDVAAKAYAQAAAAIEAEAKKSPQNAELAAQLKKAAEIAKVAATELQAAQTVHTAAATSQKAAAEKLASAMKSLTETSKMAAEAPMKAAALDAQVKAANAAIPVAKAAMDQSAAAIAPAQAAAAGAVADRASAATSLDATRSTLAAAPK